MNENIKKYKKLQNGSDIRGVALTGEVGKEPNLRKEEAEQIAKGFLLWIAEKTGKKPSEVSIAIGRDPRLSGKQLLEGMVLGFGAYGAKVLDCGLASTPAMFMATKFEEIKATGGIMITASHLPYTRNGFKFFTEEGGLNKVDIGEILSYAADEEALKRLGKKVSDDNVVRNFGKVSYETVETELMPRYSKHLRDIIIKEVNKGEKPLEGLKIIVDAGNGSGGFYAKEVLFKLGANISDSQYLSPDGTFPNHMPNPEDKEAMESICKAVMQKQADFGIIFDTDVDRFSAVDRIGNPIGRNEIVALAAALVADEFPNTTVVTDSITSNQLTKFIEKELGLKHLRFKRGYKNVIDKAVGLNEEGIDAQLAIETSGHAALKENFFLDDGAYLATKVVIAAAKLNFEGQGIDSLIEKLEKPFRSEEYRIKINSENFSEYGDEVIKTLENWAKYENGVAVVEPNYEGVRLQFDKEEGWCLLRKSLHDPILPLNIESNIEGGCEKINEIVNSVIKRFELLEL